VVEAPESLTADEPDEAPGLQSPAGEKGSAQKFARRITAVPGDTPEVAKPGRPFDLEFQDAVKKMVESALAGDVDDAVSLGHLLGRCSGKPRSEAEISMSLQNSKHIFSGDGRSWIMGNGDRRSFMSFEEYERYHWDIYDGCRVLRTVTEDDLRERIAQMAESGDVFARYLFAMWRPQSLGTEVDTKNMLDWLAYQDQALEYTLQNLDGGEPLGLLALGQSYRSSQLGLFTPRQMRFDEAYYLAARKCGLQSAWLESQIEEFINRMSDSERGLANLEQIS
jgi:hypothetical protein